MAIERARPAGGARAFEHIYDEHSAMVYRTALRVLANPTQAQDVAQDVFLRFWRQSDRFDARRGSLPNYLRLMAHTRALDVWREAQVAGRARERLKVVALHEEGRADD